MEWGNRFGLSGDFYLSKRSALSSKRCPPRILNFVGVANILEGCARAIGDVRSLITEINSLPESEVKPSSDTKPDCPAS